MRSLPPTHRIAIRKIFLQRRIEYPLHEAASLLRLNMGEVLAWVDSGQLHVERRPKRKQLGNRRHALVKWCDLASAALLRWNVMQIHDALGAEANSVLPRLLRPVELKSLRLPEYQVRLLQTLAQDAGVTVDEFLFNALLSLEGVGTPDEIEVLLPGYKEALEFPGA
jgi:hypothetical protein